MTLAGPMAGGRQPDAERVWVWRVCLVGTGGYGRVWVGEGGQKEREKKGEGGRQRLPLQKKSDQRVRERKRPPCLGGKEKIGSRWHVS